MYIRSTLNQVWSWSSCESVATQMLAGFFSSFWMSPNLTGGWRDGSCSWCLISHFAWRSHRTTVVSVATQVVLPANEWTQNDSRLVRLPCAGVLCVAKSWSFSCEGNWGTVICIDLWAVAVSGWSWCCSRLEVRTVSVHGIVGWEKTLVLRMSLPKGFAIEALYKTTSTGLREKYWFSWLPSKIGGDPTSTIQIHPVVSCRRETMLFLWVFQAQAPPWFSALQLVISNIPALPCRAFVVPALFHEISNLIDNVWRYWWRRWQMRVWMHYCPGDQPVHHCICGVSLDDPTTSLLGPTLQFHTADGHVELHPDGLHWSGNSKVPWMARLEPSAWGTCKISRPGRRVQNHRNFGNGACGDTNFSSIWKGFSQKWEDWGSKSKLWFVLP